MGEKISRSMVLRITVAFAVVFATFDLLVKAQDPANQNPTATTQNSNTMRTSGSRRGGAKSKSKTAATTGVAQDPSTPSATEATPAMQTETTTGSSPKATTRKKRGRQITPASDTAASATAQTEQTDLSGTYTGNFKCDDIGLTGDTTLTINGNQFTTADGKTGRIVASTTHGYTAVALQAGDTGTPTAGMSATAPPVISLRARKNGDRLTLMPVAGSTHTCSFTPSRTVAGKRRSPRAPQPVPAATGTEVTSPAEAGPTPADVTTPRTPARGKTRRGNVRPSTVNTTVTPTAVPSPVPSPMPSKSPAPVPTPSESPLPSPTPSPAPNPSPTPAPSPTPSPAPSATPVPSASPAPSASPSPTPTPPPSRG
jgi:hypothetical protein